MDETTILSEETTAEGGVTDTVNEVFDGLLQVFGFFRTIVDAIKSVMKPLLESVLSGVL